MSNHATALEGLLIGSVWPIADDAAARLRAVAERLDATEGGSDWHMSGAFDAVALGSSVDGMADAARVTSERLAAALAAGAGADELLPLLTYSECLTAQLRGALAATA